MTYTHGVGFLLESITASSYQSATYNSYHTLGYNCRNWAAIAQVGILSNTGNLRTSISHGWHGGESNAPTGAWTHLATIPVMQATSATHTAFNATSLTGLMPYVKISTTVEAPAATTTDFKNVLVRLLTDIA